MSDLARVMEKLRQYDWFIKNVISCADALTVTTANNASNAILSAGPPSLQQGRDYSITAATIAPGTWFKWHGSTTIRLNQPAIATGTNQNCIVQPYAGDLL